MKKIIYNLALVCATIVLVSCVNTSAPASQAPVEISDPGRDMVNTDAPTDSTCEEKTVSVVEPHYYATVLQEFMDNSAGKTTAVLYDLDGCGNDEMIAFNEGVPKNDSFFAYADGGKITIYDIKDGKPISSTLELEYLINSYDIYISNKNYLVVSDYWEGDVHRIYKYENGVLAKVTDLGLGGHGESDEDGWEGHYYIDGMYVSESKLFDKFNEFGIEYENRWTAEFGIADECIAVTIGSGRGESHTRPAQAPKDDTAEILAMTALG